MVFVEGPCELGNGGGDFDPAEEDAFLSLHDDVLGPLDEPGEVTAGLYIVADSEVPGSFFEEGVGLLLHLLASFLCLYSLGLSNNNLTITRSNIILK